ncbi:MFS transporter [Herbidospora yilanensis]|uniref:MFS transporter n=1 Tax=Herbidospora yilanensis TaxID=354426 RepID=UPI00078171E6|nr:MFS transporter [Herbidospora yilanensis]
MSTREESVQSAGVAGSVAVLCLSAFVVMIDSTVVQVMVPALTVSFGAGLDDVLWVFNGFVIAYAALLITAGRLGGVHGPRRLLIAGLVVFALASLAGGLAASLPQLVAARVAQGVGGAMIVPQALTLIATVFPAERRGAALGLVSATMALAAVLGPVGGGLVVTTWGWRWVFLVNVPVCLAAVVLARRWVPPGVTASRGRLDWGGVVLIGVGLATTSYALLGPGRLPWLVPAAVLIAVFTARQRRHPDPLMPPRVFRDRAFLVAGWLGAAQFGVLAGLMLLVSVRVQGELGGDAIDTGLALLPMAVAAGLVSPVAGWLSDRIGGGPIMAAGMVALGVGASGFALFTSGPAVAALAVAGLGVGLVMAPASTEAIRRLAPDLVPAASGVLNTARQAASLLGVAVIGGIAQAGPDAFTTAAGALTALALFSGLAGLFLLPRHVRDDALTNRP